MSRPAKLARRGAAFNERGVPPLEHGNGPGMVDKDETTEETPAAPAAPAPRRGPGHRGADMRDTVAEMAERAQLISQEAGSKVSAAMKDVISAAAGLAGFAIESARDLVQYMVRRGQMTQEEADKLIREAEDAHGRKPASEKIRPTASKIAADKAAVDKAARDAANAAAALIAPPQRPGAFSLRTGGPRPVVKPSAPAPAAAPTTAPAAPVKAAAAPARPVSKPSGKPAPKAPAKSAPSAHKVAGKASPKVTARSTAKSPVKGKSTKPAAKSGSARPGAKPPAKPTPAGKSKSATKKKR